jgi:hypothetical protein
MYLRSWLRRIDSQSDGWIGITVGFRFTTEPKSHEPTKSWRRPIEGTLSDSHPQTGFRDGAGHDESRSPTDPQTRL